MHQGDITDVQSYTYEQNKMFLDYIGDEINALNYDEKERKKQDLQRQREEKGLILKPKSRSMVEIREN